jgi:putative ABC transport system permease protein
MFTDENFLTMMRMRLKEGRYFTEADNNLPAGTALINEAAVQMFGWKNPLEEKLIIPGDNGAADEEVKIVGVINDFHFASLHHPIEPLAIMQQSPKGVGGNMVVELNGNDIKQAITDAGDAWKKTYPNKPFEYTFLSDTFSKMYVAEDKMFTIFIYFAALAILLSGLGLYGLSAYTAQQRTKEIGIRKVMGATEANILLMINRDFIRLVLVAVIIACPIAWWAMHNWLQKFAYHTELSAVVIIVASLTALLLAFITVSSQALRAASANPVQSLRYE